MSDDPRENLIQNYANLVHKVVSRMPRMRRGPSSQIVELHRQAFDEIRRRLGETPEQIFAKEASLGRELVADALSNITSWKSWNDLPMSDVERAFVGRVALIAEVNNGGFHQYFFNSSGDHWRCLLQAFDKSGDHGAARRFREVLAIFPNSSPDEDRQKRWKQLHRIEDDKGQEMWDFFARHENAFYDAPFPDPEKFWTYIVSEHKNINIVWV